MPNPIQEHAERDLGNIYPNDACDIDDGEPEKRDNWSGM